MHYKLKWLGVIILIAVIIPDKACAYLDPGTGSMIVQVIVAGIVGIGCTLSMYKRKVVDFFKHIGNKREK